MQGTFNRIKGSDRQCMVVELRMQNCGEILRIHFRHIQRFNDV